MNWIVVRNTGDRADLVRGLEKKEVRRPKAMSQVEFRELFSTDSSTDDETIATLAQGFS